MAQNVNRNSGAGKVYYTLRPKKDGRSAFSDVKLPNGTVVRRVDASVHERALSNVVRAYREKD